MVQGQLYLTESELEKFTDDDDDTRFYLRKEHGVEDIGAVRPVITDSYMENCRHLECFDFRDEDWSGSIQAWFEHYKKGYECSEQLEVVVVPEPNETAKKHIKAAALAMRSDMPDSPAIAAMFEDVANEIRENGYYER